MDTRRKPRIFGVQGKTRLTPRVPWRKKCRVNSIDLSFVPNGVRAVVEALRFNGRSGDRLRAVPEDEWPALLAWCDDRQVTLLLGARCYGDLPARVRESVRASRERYAQRYARLERDLGEMVDAFHRQRLDFALLKGMSHAPALTPDPLLRAQGDIDLWFTSESISGAREVLSNLGYMPNRRRGARDDSRHLAPMVRAHNWKWRGDIFDPEMPIHVEAHYRLWSDSTDYIPIPGQMDFWNRRVTRTITGRPVCVLCPQDLLGFAALHFLLHLMHGDLPLQRAWEIAFFLQENAQNNEFWSRWRQLHSPALRRLQALVFAVAQIWFCCDVHKSVEREVQGLAGDVRLWLDHFALSPLRRYSEPNKDEVWLHLALVHSPADRARVLLRRLFPFVLSRKGGLTWARLAHHGRTFMPTVLGGLRWMQLKRRMNRAQDPASPRRESPLPPPGAIDPRSSSSPTLRAHGV